MELCKEYKSLNSSIEKESLCESFELDLQESLPQYLDDIEKVVMCSAKCIVTDYECTSGAIKLYGKSIISLTYLNSEDSLLSNIFEDDFTRIINTSNNDINFANINLVVKYSSYRLINQRRIDVHTSLKADITAFSSQNDKCLSNCKNAFVKEFNAQTLVEKFFGICSEEFDETFTISNTNYQIKNIVNTFSNCVVEEKKIIQDKMLVKLRIEISVLYENENSDIEKSVHTFSLSKIIDISNAGENDNAFVSSSLSSIYVKTKANSKNQLCDIEVVGKATINYRIYSLTNDEYITDAYMTKFNTDIETKNITLKTNPSYYFDEKSLDLTFDIEKNIIEILDLKADVNDCKINNSNMIVSVKLSFLYIDDTSQLCYFENVQDYELLLNDTALNGISVANISSFDYVIKNANSVTLRLKLEYNAYLFTNKSIDYITDINTSTQKDNSNMPQLTLYFAQKDENAWDIAKKFSTAVSLIMEENNLTSDVIDAQRVILVPGM